uniref:SpoIID/LytB domain-containing protein n=1 Tax=candidate division WWE3 bacterium TaxID=2053526 RepID=A0A831Z2H1_UNCKA
MVLKLPPVRKLLIPIAFFLLTALIAFSVPPSRADELDDVTAELTRQQQQLSDLEKRQQQLSRDISSAFLSLSQVSIQLTAAEDELAAIESDLAAKESELAQQEQVRNLLVRRLYIQSRTSAVEIILSSEDLGGSVRQFQYYNENLNNLGETISQLAEQVTLFQSNKTAAQKIRDDLAALRDQYQSTVSSSQRQLSSTKSQISSVQNVIGQLSTRQQQLLAEKYGSVATTVGDVTPSSDNQLLVNPGFSPAYAGFSFGSAHHVGMSQYGARGRALANQDYRTILSAYYANFSFGGSCDPNRTINVRFPDGHIESMLLESEYLTGLGEMPSSWPMEALKAQVVAARSYALDYAARAGSICTTTSCQVFVSRGSKNGTPWQTAVEQTCGEVMLYNGAPIAAYYASTSGGYTWRSCDAWGGTCRAWTKITKDWANPSAPLQDILQQAYEGVNYGASPWFYKAWYKGSSGRPNAWMNNTEFTDILNATRLYIADNSTRSHLSQLDKPNPDTWSAEKVRQELSALGITPVSSISNVISSMSEDRGYGYTKWVYFETNLGTLTVDGPTFYAIFNIRAPAEIYFASPLYKVEPK